MKRHLLILVFVFLFLGMVTPSRCEGRVLILPFQVMSPGKKDHLWLGRAISYYLTKGLEFNSIDAIPDNRVHSLLNSYNISFPYQISKASGIKLSVLAGADTIIWGEVLWPEKPESEQIQVRGYIIDLNRQSQKYLPLIKFNVKDLYAFQREMLAMALNYFQKPRADYPELNLDLHSYETFIKSLLLTDPHKKIQLLESAFPGGSGAELIKLELAKFYLSTGDLEKAGHDFEDLPESGFLKTERQFLSALINLGRGNREDARVIFSDLLDQKQFISESSNNLGVMRFQDHDLDQAEKFFARSLQENRDPDVYGNYVNSLIKSAQEKKAIATVNTALSSFPDDENLIKLFSFFMARDPNRDRLIPVFRKYIPEMYLPEQRLPDIPTHMKNPFEIQVMENFSYLSDVDKTLKLIQEGNRIEALKNCDRLMEINPFIPRLHRMLQEIYRQQKNLKQAKLYSLSASYLENQNRL
jgi:tetratricopeptide (TPR) repeat protein